MPASTEIPSSDGHFLAGLIDAEAHFGICEHNGGRSRQCLMRIKVRADDLALLRWMKALTGLGSIYDARASGNPQAEWIVGRRRETAALVELLSVFPLRSRKRKEFELWKQAVGLWQDPAPLRDIAAMERLRRRLIAQRVYKPAGQSEISTIAMEPDGLTEWLAGFLTGEAHFGIHQGAIRLALNVRADDLPLLRGLRLAMGAGTVGGPYVNRGSNPAAKWSVTRTSDLLDLANRLDQRVRGRKAVEFEIWQRAVRIRADTSTPAARRRRLIDAARAELIELRRYRPGESPLAAKSRRLQRMYEQNGVWLALLRDWAAAEPGPLTAMAYQRARHSDWPARNTLTLRFGSWYDALAAAGLNHRAALSPEARDLRLRGGTQARAERRRHQRARVVAAFRRCQQTLGRSPGPSEYARWRLHNDPAAPTFGTAYRLFPGGWSELRSAAVSAA